VQLQPSDPDIQTIVARIRSGDLDLQPEFQRGEVWPVAKKRRLIDSILRRWHVPPIHVVVDEDGRQVVLDGQQRLVSIRDFVDGEFKVDGSIEPADASIERLDGLRYEKLPADVRRGFDQFTIRMFRITDYSPEEPGELFFRLNQMTFLTAAEQRNAFFGPVRQQVKDLVNALQLKTADGLIGFSNRRMAFDDVIAKVLCTLEAGTLARKLTAGDISSRFRKSEPFSSSHFDIASGAIELLNSMLNHAGSDARFNKASLFTWIIFLTYFTKSNSASSSNLDQFLTHFNKQREDTQSGILGSIVLDKPNPGDKEFSLMRIYIDRSSSRVSDVSSVILRDFVVWALFQGFAGDELVRKLLKAKKHAVLVDGLKAMLSRPRHIFEVNMERYIDFDAWGSLR
jgi:hypothetical protein